MKTTTLQTQVRFVLFSLILLVGLTGCNGRATPTPEITPSATSTPEATATATLAPARIVLFDPAAQAGADLTGVMNEFASANSLVFETWPSITGDLNGVKIMVLNGNLDNLSEVAAAAPQTQFVTLTQNIAPAGNISILTINPTHLSYMAGFLAAMTSEDWRATALIEEDAALGLADAFVNGGNYLCGLCTPIYAPMLYYPQVYTVPPQSDLTAWSTQATALKTDTTPDTVFVGTTGDDPAVLDVFSDAILFSSNTASPDLSRYAAILGADSASALEQALPDLLAGNGGKSLTARIGLVQINNPEIVTDGKKALFDQTAQDLANNLINPLSVP